jgi:hypothetical protein
VRPQEASGGIEEAPLTGHQAHSHGRPSRVSRPVLGLSLKSNVCVEHQDAKQEGRFVGSKLLPNEAAHS